MVNFPVEKRAVERLPELADGTIQVWQLALSELPVQLQWLSPRELDRYQAISHPGPARDYAANRTLLRWLLGQLLEQPPSEVLLTVDEHGKPALPSPAGAHFNLSHSGDWLLIALRRDAEVGIDLDHQRPALAIERIARRVFTAEQFDDLAARHFAMPAFLDAWSGLEARQKCIGQGIFGQRAESTTSHLNWTPAADYRAALAWPKAKPPLGIDYLTLTDSVHIDTPATRPA